METETGLLQGGLPASFELRGKEYFFGKEECGNSAAVYYQSPEELFPSFYMEGRNFSDACSKMKAYLEKRHISLS